MASVNFFDKLSDDIIGACLIPCLGSSLHSISLLASVSKRFRKIICSNQYHESSFWADINVSICIDTYCPICNLNTNKVKFKKSAFSLLSSYPIENLQMHCFVSDIYDVLTSLISKQTIKNINLKLTNKLSSPPLVEILSQSIIPDCFQQLRSLTINSTNLNHVNLAGRVLILQLLGRNLEYLKFEGLTPVGIFKIISQVCVHLKNLRVDKVKSGVDFNELHSDTIEEIALCRAQFIPDNLKKFSRLSSLRYTSWAHLNGIQIEHIILSLPQSIKSLDMEIPSSFVDLMYLSVARRLPEIETLILESSHERGIISADVLLNLAHQCKCIKHFEIYRFIYLFIIIYFYNFTKTFLLHITY